MNWKNLEENSICNHFNMLGENTKKKMFIHYKFPSRMASTITFKAKMFV